MIGYRGRLICLHHHDTPGKLALRDTNADFMSEFTWLEKSKLRDAAR